MMFGEIVEPSTRALILDADELDELPAYKNPIYEWQGDSQPQLDIDNLIFADSPTVLQICSYITKNIQPVAQILQEGLAIYKLDRNYLVVFNGKSKDLVVGQHGGFVRKENYYEPDDEIPLNDWLGEYKDSDYEYDTDEDVPMLSKNKLKPN
ncbi:hypothetical protein D910_06058 [Dendroctonus ponderosae]|uniref:Uncharacterized protein n=1 Tax=Dendroctonus ponderosae TaxID=77166 RepID=U4U444_DENPD|nr:hypothetical protein D910_06058 [Dendroctonus ponderosae]